MRSCPASTNPFGSCRCRAVSGYARWLNECSASALVECRWRQSQPPKSASVRDSKRRAEHDRFPSWSGRQCLLCALCRRLGVVVLREKTATIVSPIASSLQLTLSDHLDHRWKLDRSGVARSNRPPLAFGRTPTGWAYPRCPQFRYCDGRSWRSIDCDREIGGHRGLLLNSHLQRAPSLIHWRARLAIQSRAHDPRIPNSPRSRGDQLFGIGGSRLGHGVLRA
jgi:hypothetical protein